MQFLNLLLGMNRRIFGRVTFAIFLTISLLVPLSSHAQYDEDEGDDLPFSDYNLGDRDRERKQKNDPYMRNGRYIAANPQIGLRSFTGNLGQMYQSAMDYGIGFSLFWRENLAFRLAYILGDHGVEIQTPGQAFKGTVQITSILFHLYSYFPTWKWSKKSAFSLNPYWLGGISQNSRIYRISGNSITQDSGLSIDLGGGVDYPLSKNNYSIGLQIVYQLVRFADEDAAIMVRDSTGAVTSTGQYPSGDSYTIGTVFNVFF
ncbi:MAG: hypothetical protein ABL958_06395 [Bdellovibrionia bacterium]